MQVLGAVFHIVSGITGLDPQIWYEGCIKFLPP